jgi:hypothetical protein
MAAVCEIDASYLDCPICLEQYDDADDRTPIILECGHTFCRTCVTAIYGGLHCHCPNCRKYIVGRPGTRNLLLLGLATERRRAEERTRRERFDRGVTRAVAFLLADPVFFRMRALFVDVLFPEVGIAYDPVANRVAAPVADDTLDQFVRLVEAVFTDATVVSAWQAAPPQFFHYTDRSFTTALYVLRYPPDTPISVKRDMMRSLLSNLPPLPLPPPPPMAPAPAVIVLSDADEDVNDAMDEEDCETFAEWESDAPVVPVPAVPAPPAPVPAPAVRLRVPGNVNRAAVRRRRTFAPIAGGLFRVVRRTAGDPSSSPLLSANGRHRRPAVTDSFWDATLAAAEHFGGLFAGGAAGCVWTHAVVPKLYGSFRGPLLDLASKHQYGCNAELLRRLKEVLEPKLGVTLGSDEAVVVSIIQDAATSRRAINRIGHYLLGSRMGPERRPLGEPEVRAVMAATGLIVVY